MPRKDPNEINNAYRRAADVNELDYEVNKKLQRIIDQSDGQDIDIVKVAKAA